MSVACALQQIGPPMSLMGQNRKSSQRANVFRSSLNNGHSAVLFATATYDPLKLLLDR
jgi:hypothetical protein